MLTTNSPTKFIDEHQAVFKKEFEDYGCTVYDLTPDEIALFKEKTQSVYATIEQHMKDINSPAYDTLVKVANEYLAAHKLKQRPIYNEKSGQCTAFSLYIRSNNRIVEYCIYVKNRLIFTLHFRYL